MIRALFLSLLIHAVLAAALALYLVHAPAPDTLAELDLTSVDLSFAETPDDVAAVMPAMPSQDVAAREKPPETPPHADPIPPPPERAAVEPTITPLPPPDVREPTAARVHVVTPVVAPQPAPVEAPQPVSAAASQPVPAVAPRQARVDAPPRPRRNIKPDYPREARQRGEQGRVTLEIDVAADGGVADVRIVTSTGFALLDEAAVKAAKGARFTPAKAGGKPVASSARLSLEFKLR